LIIEGVELTGGLPLSHMIACFTGSNGSEFMFLLKGHEDLRQDERVMQLFGLVNTLLANDPETFKRHLRYVGPLCSKMKIFKAQKCFRADKSASNKSLQFEFFTDCLPFQTRVT